MRRANPDEPARSLRARAEAESLQPDGTGAAHRRRGGEHWNLVTAVALVAWLLVLGYSALMQQDAASGRVRRVLFFPELPYHGAAQSEQRQVRVLHQEVRYVPYRSRAEPALRLLVEETILGPADHRTYHLLPAGVRVISTHVADAVAYVNLSHHALLGATAIPSSGGERIGTLTDIILFNFPRLRAVRILVDGQEPRLVPAPTEGADDG
ncbi:MAG: GerMN domain-containing protein [Spirochaetaceae bacterium]|nr:GerMN domain-containing protein [Spirochaetaceae bacterium]